MVQSGPAIAPQVAGPCTSPVRPRPDRRSRRRGRHPRRPLPRVCCRSAVAPPSWRSGGERGTTVGSGIPKVIRLAWDLAADARRAGAVAAAQMGRTVTTGQHRPGPIAAYESLAINRDASETSHPALIEADQSDHAHARTDRGTTTDAAIDGRCLAGGVRVLDRRRPADRARPRSRTADAPLA